MTQILIVEDNANNMKLATLLLEGIGYHVLKAGDATVGLELARTHLPDLVLMDIQLPGMDGLTATRLLKDDSNTSNIKVYALTAFAMKGDEEKIRAAGCDGYIAKPIRYKEFLDTVTSILGTE